MLYESQGIPWEINTYNALFALDQDPDLVRALPLHLPMVKAGSNLPAIVGLWAFLVARLTCSDR